MKRFYYVVSEHDSGKNYAYVLVIGSNNNLLAVLEDYKKAKVVQPCESKKKAHELAEFWNDSYRNNGTYLFDKDFYKGAHK